MLVSIWHYQNINWKNLCLFPFSFTRAQPRASNCGCDCSGGIYYSNTRQTDVIILQKIIMKKSTISSVPTTTSTTTIRIMWSIDLYTIRDAPFFTLLFLIIKFIWKGWTTFSLLVRVRVYYLWAYYVHISTGLKSNSVLCVLYCAKTSSLTEISNILHPSLLSCLVI